jgi:RNA polymerase sigma-70 factor (ECF subfamily)
MRLRPDPGPAPGIGDRGGPWEHYLVRIAAGDRDGLAALYDESAPRVFSVALRILRDRADAEDVTAEVYAQVWRDAKTFDARRGAPAAWIATIARTRALDRFRRRAHRRAREEPLEHAERRGDDQSPEETAAASQVRERIRAALASLPADQRRVLELAFYAGLTHSELARTLGEPLGTVKTRIRLGMTKLREKLAALAPEQSVDLPSRRALNPSAALGA